MFASFLTITLVFLIAKYKIQSDFETRNGGNTGSLMVLFLTYFFVLVFVQIFENNALVLKKCGEERLIPVIQATIIPNVLIFSLIIVILKIFPGWKGPFSNTIGYLFSKGLNIKGSFDDLLIKGNTSDSLMKRIIEDKSLIINEISTSNFDEFLKNMDNFGILSTSWKKLLEATGEDTNGEKLEDGPKGDSKTMVVAESLQNLWKAVVLKDLIAEVMWYFLAGTLVISIIKSNIGDMDCVSSSTTSTTS